MKVDLFLGLLAAVTRDRDEFMPKPTTINIVREECLDHECHDMLADAFHGREATIEQFMVGVGPTPECETALRALTSSTFIENVKHVGIYNWESQFTDAAFAILQEWVSNGVIAAVSTNTSCIDIARLFTDADMSKIQCLNITGDVLEEHARVLAENPTFTELRQLEMKYAEPGVIRTLASVPKVFAKLKTIFLKPDAAAALFETATLPLNLDLLSIKSQDFHSRRLDDFVCSGLTLFCAAITHPGLPDHHVRALELSDHTLTLFNAKRMASSMVLCGMKRLCITSTRETVTSEARPSIRAIVNSPFITSALESLELSTTNATRSYISDVISSPHLRRLRVLEINRPGVHYGESTVPFDRLPSVDVKLPSLVSFTLNGRNYPNTVHWAVTHIISGGAPKLRALVFVHKTTRDTQWFPEMLMNPSYVPRLENMGYSARCTPSECVKIVRARPGLKKFSFAVTHPRTRRAEVVQGIKDDIGPTYRVEQTETQSQTCIVIAITPKL